MAAEHTIDGARGEGGGQVLRTALGLALVTGRPIRVRNVRGRRSRPGLLRQHLTALRAAAAVGEAAVEGDALGSREVRFAPRAIRPGRHHFAVGTAGSATLVLQTVLPALLRADGPSELVLEGGTDNQAAPPFDFLAEAFAPLVRRLGAGLALRLERRGYYPAGGGRFVAEITPGPLRPFELLERGEARLEAVARVAALPEHIGHRELKVLKEGLRLGRGQLRLEHRPDAQGPGNTAQVLARWDGGAEVFTGFGKKGKPAEKVARDALVEALRWREARVPVGEHLADQLMLLLALAGGGRFRTVRPSLHTRTQAELIPELLGVGVGLTELDAELEADRWEVRVG